jgi:pyruvate dehydrogenase E2 component (dihydrolipoamide acetyltransferase)
MITEIVMPDVGHAEARATVVRWLVQEGEQVEIGTLLVEVETDKATLTIEAFKSGFLRKILAMDGETMPTGAVIALMSDTLDELLPEVTSGPETIAREPPTVQPAIQPGQEEASPRQVSAGDMRALPAARRLASEKGVDLSSIVGSGHRGVITEEDVLLAIEREKALKRAGMRRIPLSARRRLIAERMAESKRDIPHFYISAEVDMTEAEQLRNELNRHMESEEATISPTDLILRAVGVTLKEFPTINAAYTDEGILASDEVNLGIAVEAEEGIVVPVLREADPKSLRQIAQERTELVRGAREGGLTSRQLSGATFTVSNLGMYGIESFAAIINPPEVGILAVGSIVQQPGVVGDRIAIRSMMRMTLSVDHRVVDGALAARFLARIREWLESPHLLNESSALHS